MAGAFEAFVQSELPLRPFAPTDGNQESIAIRRGEGPRQLQFLDLQDGQVLARVDGEMRGVSINNMGTGNGMVGGVRHFVANVDAGNEISTWNLTHNLDSFNCVVQVYQLNADNSYSAMIPDSITLLDADTVELKFSTAVAGKAILSFVD